MTQTWSTLGLAVLLLTCTAGCSFRDQANAAHGCNASCPPGHCYLGYCLTDATGIPSPGTGGTGVGIAGNQAGGGGVSGAGAGTGTGTGTGGTGTTVTTIPQGPCVADAACYLGAAETRGMGSCRDGKAQCNGTAVETCVGQITPLAEACNGADDDCDGQVDEDLDLGSCPASGQGACGAGMMRCEQGVAVCRAGKGPSPEVCNGIDDDCDGAVDNGTDEACYPTDMPGCVANSSGGFDCMGVCSAGKRLCQGGQLQACTGFVQPSKEVCGGAEARDENCNGQIDDGCPCTGSATQRCYGGPALTAGVGICLAGTQTCQNGAFGACEGSVVPRAESCSNQGTDDDCNGYKDDVPGLGLLCVNLANQGVCVLGVGGCTGSTLTCVTPTPKAHETTCDGNDDDCDGSVDEDFKLATDEQNCGACGTTCSTGDLCCGGACHHVISDAQDCGACGNACGSSSACCNGACVPTTTADHCGGCGGCTTGQACCGGACVPTNTTDHCGGCGGCTTGQACCGGACVPTDTTDHCGGCGGCTTGQACCGGACVPTDTTDHCGGCGGCTTGQACCGGGCVPTDTTDHCGGCGGCTTGQACCGGGCVPTDTTDHCGGCGGCTTGQACCGGGCVPTDTTDHCGGCAGCGSGQACCGGACKMTDSDDQNCGGCGMACTSTDCHCSSGQCKDTNGVACQ